MSNEPEILEPGDAGEIDWRGGRFPELMPRRVERILLVSSPYDSFILEEDGLLTELIFAEYRDLGLTHAPSVTRVATGEEALVELRRERFDLAITMLRLGDMALRRFCQTVRSLAPEMPLVMLAANEWEAQRCGELGRELTDDIYVWNGDAKIFLAIIKIIEDRWNVGPDTQIGGVGVIIVIEDSVRFRSSLLPIIYTELVRQTRAVMADSLNRMHKLVRMRARPKILVAETYERGLALYEDYREYLFGVISDVRFPREGRLDPTAGLHFVRHVRAKDPDLPALLESSDPENAELAGSVGAHFIHKQSNTLLQDVREFIVNNYGFGDFVFRAPDRRELARASDLRGLARVLRDLPLESLEYHARRNHFSNWLRARTEFGLARRLRPRRVGEFADLESLRRYLVRSVEETIRENRRGTIEDFAADRFDAASRFVRLGGGSLGGKARGLAFVDALLTRHGLERAFEDVRVQVPQTLVIGTDAFDAFLEQNRLRLLALRTANDEWITWAFQTADLPGYVVESLRSYLAVVRAPLAVRSSSLLEDSLYHPFAGIYATYMLPNDQPDEHARLTQLCDAIKLVYASTYLNVARRYLEATPHRIEEEKMAVILQPVVGRPRGPYYYPSFAGVARSYNFYPFGHMRPEDGMALVALGLGLGVVDGGEALRFCPAHPQILPQLASGRDFLNQSQRSFLALDLREGERAALARPEFAIVQLDLELAETHGTLAPVGSVWSQENRAFYDGIYRDGPRVVTFAHVLKSDLFPLAEILRRLLEIGRQGMNGPVELEFAVNLDTRPREFAVLQMRPYAQGTDADAVDLEDLRPEQLLCESYAALGHGVIDGLSDVLYVKPECFSASRTAQIAREVGVLNERLRAQGRRCVLIGPGRWGSSNHWLGIPVNWAQISTARIIVEASQENFAVEPSQGSHFFQNLTSLGIAYLTVNARMQQGFIDWPWLARQPVFEELEFLRWVRLAAPLQARIDGPRSRAALVKPTAG